MYQNSSMYQIHPAVVCIRYTQLPMSTMPACCAMRASQPPRELACLPNTSWRQVVFGAFAAPIVYSFFFLIVLGSLGIKMERASELALGVQPDVMAGTVDCTAMGYAGNAPNSTAAKGLAMAGYFPLACRAHPDRLFDVLSAYGEGIFYFLGVVSTIGVTLYFVTSSDSGSFVDDTLSAQGVYYLT